ncbi:carbohydrate kinase family protein [Solicola sp. PLA-1-18]|uniref:carbohydrate kinase family protein n=1 Tax=Solicola sp. PLA-1-18 TaxID=3380532 RepID=UPI003B765DD6
MPIAVTGSIATDHLMTFQGRFADSLVVEQLDKISVSFLVDDLQVRRGGCGANISFGLAALGLRPVLVGAVGRDFDEYRRWLEDHGVDCSAILVSATKHTARFVCTTDESHAQFASFYAGAMSEARDIDLAALHAAHGFDLVLVGPDDPDGMLRHTQTCRDLQIPFAADPSQQLAFADGETIRGLVDGATYLFTNEYEATLTERKTGWSADEIASRIGTRVITRGADGVTVQAKDQAPIEVAAVPGVLAVDPTGVGDSFRAGFLAAIEVDLGLERAAQVGCALAAGVVETTGTQEYDLRRGPFGKRFADAYGSDAWDEVAAVLSVPE